MKAKLALKNFKQHHFRQRKVQFSQDYIDLPTRSIEDINRLYDISCRIDGEGTYGTVKKAVLKINKHRVFAIKNIRKRQADIQNDLEKVMYEIELMKILDHPNIERFYEVYEDKSNFFLVLEYLGGGDLFDRIVRKKKVPENEAKKYMW